MFEVLQISHYVVDCPNKPVSTDAAPDERLASKDLRGSGSR
jgi:hypothetical protein